MSEEESPNVMLMITIGVLIAIIIILVILVIIDAVHNPDRFINKSQYGYYWETDTSSFVSNDDRLLATSILQEKIKRLGISDITVDQLRKLHDENIIELLELNMDGDLTTKDIAALRMYMEPGFYLAGSYVNQAISLGNKFVDDIQRKLVYSIIEQYQKMANAADALPPLDKMSDEEIIKTFMVIRTVKSILESDGYDTVDMGRITDLSAKYANGSSISIKPKVVISDHTVPTNGEIVTTISTPAITMQASK